MEKKACNSEDVEVRKGPWTMEEDLILMNYIANHGEGVWNTLARSAGLKRTGKSCRLRWLNYLRPDVKRGNITPEEQLLIMELHAKWGNRWSKIAKYLPGRTDNEIKNFWRTRIQKHMKQIPTTNQSITTDQHSSSTTDRAASSSQVSASNHNHADHAIDQYYSSSAPFNMGIMDAFPQVMPNAFPIAVDSNDNMWGIEELWSMQLLNGDQ